MVLINTVTVEAINTALIALQRGENITIGGEKSGTVNNISVTNNGTGSGTDVSPQLNALDKRVTEVENENERQNERIAGLEGLGIESVEFEEGSRTLFIYLVNGDVLDVVIPDSPLTLSLNGTTLTLSSDGQTLSNVELPFIPSSEKGVANGVATLDSTGRIPSTQMPTNIVNSVNTMTGDVVLNGTNVNYDNQSGSPTLKDKIDSVETKADTQVDWNESNSSSLAFIKNKPTIPAAQVQSDWTQSDNTQKDFIKHKIPIWIVAGTSGSDMTPVDNITDGQMRPPTSNAVFDVLNPLAVSKGGTGQTTQLATNKAIIAEMTEGTSDVTDGTMFVSSNATNNGFAETNDSGPNRPYKRKFSTVWNYIKSKIQNAGSLIIGIASTVGTKLKLKGVTYGTNTYTDNNPKVVFENTDATQNISLTFTDYDAVQGPSSLTLNGNQGGEYFIAPNIKATTRFYGNVTGNVSGEADSVNITWLLNQVYPPGSIFMSIYHVSPASWLGGTWKEITDGRFIRASGTNAGSVPTMTQIKAGTGVQAEGLPNITGAISNASGTYGVTGFESSAGSFTGAFSGATLSGKSHTGASTDSGSAKVVNFNASNGNSTVPDGASSGKIYGNSSHVTPKNMAVYMWIRTE